MTPKEELDLILKLIRKYNLPLSPILEYAVNEKKEEYPDEDMPSAIIPEIIETQGLDTAPSAQDKIKFKEESATIELTRELIEAARTPNGGFTKSQLAVIGIEWPPQHNWIDDIVGTFITPKQLEEFNHIEYVTKKTPTAFSSPSLKGMKTYKYVAIDDEDRKRMEALLRAMERFDVPATSRDVARSISRSAWGGVINETSVINVLNRLPEVELVPGGKYILKDKLVSSPINKYVINQARVTSDYSECKSDGQHNSTSIEKTVSPIRKDVDSHEQYRLVSPIFESSDITLDLIQKMVDWDKRHRVLDDWKLKVMQDVVDGTKEFTDKMKYAFYLNLQALIKNGFSCNQKQEL